MKIILLFCTIFFLAACSKPDPIEQPGRTPVMQYTDFKDQEIKFNEYYSADLNQDGTKDFSIYTLLVGDAISKTDYHQYYFGSAVYTEFPININEEVPLLFAETIINNTAFAGYNWWPLSDIVMAQKVITLNKPPSWKGNWQNALYNYLPLRLLVGTDIFYGWVEVSFDRINEKVILHRAGICRENGKAVRAGM